MRTRGIIVGGGIIGSALAYELSRNGVSDLHVIDPDLEGGYSSTERNAGGVRHLWEQPINIELARHSIAFFEKVRDEIGFIQSGYLWLYAKENAGAGEKTLERLQKHNLSYELLDVTGIQKKYPFLDKMDDIACALFGSKDGLLNSNALKTYFRAEAKKKGVTFHNGKLYCGLKEGAQVEVGVADVGGGAEDYLKNPQLPVATDTWKADFVVMCTGGWGVETLKPLLPNPNVRPIRRQISVFKAENFDLNAYGMIVDTSGVYFHPEGGNILAGLVLKDEKPGFRFDADPNFFEEFIWPALYERSSKLEKLKPVTAWGGLYSYTPDTTGVLGRVPGYRHVYESHSFTGRGVMQCYGAAIAIRELILDGKFTTMDATLLHRDRFSDPNARPLTEGAHI